MHLYQGQSTKLLKDLSKENIFKEATGNSINSKKMKDRYYILRYIAFFLYQQNKLKDRKGKLIEYKSDINDFLGKTMEFLNYASKDLLQELREKFLLAMENSYNILGKDCFRIPSKTKKRPVNIALFESLSYLMSFDIVKNNPIKVKEKIKLLFTDKDFIVSLTQSADSSKNVKIRFFKNEKYIKGT